ncbi:hypothetical protein D0Y65_031009 [Glycine soja]|uniref:Uncharacterized protein n=1 Tax=Glycine soja TaxID=3848 RepID=A0A445I682_GLYSO|nr:hypothetical protein D0Y65_031009 [Glycine soja]
MTRGSNPESLNHNINFMIVFEGRLFYISCLATTDVEWVAFYSGSKAKTDVEWVDAPSAYVCAGSRIYDATEWYICQNAVHAGAFDNFSGTATESPSPKSGNGMKSLCDPC